MNTTSFLNKYTLGLTIGQIKKKNHTSLNLGFLATKICESKDLKGYFFVQIK
jgi:hypothetical protein